MFASFERPSFLKVINDASEDHRARLVPFPRTDSIVFLTNSLGSVALNCSVMILDESNVSNGF